MINFFDVDAKLQIKNNLRKLDRYRKRKMSFLANMMFSFINNNGQSERQIIEAEEVKEVLIVRINNRVGNMVFLIPFIHQVKHYYPNARITLLINKPWQEDIFANLGVDAFEYANLSFSSLPQCIETIRRLRQRKFDLCLSPIVSAQSSVMCSLISARNKVSYSSRYDNAFTHTYTFHTAHSHEALNSLSLLPQLHGSVPAFDVTNSHQLIVTEDECRKGFSSKEKLVSNDALCVAFFRGARGDKKLTDADWCSILRQFERAHPQQISWIEVLGPEISSPLFHDIPVYRSKSLRELACFLRYTDGFISCDTGPLHLADAAGARCIGLYTHTDPARYGLLGESCFQVTELNNIDACNILRTIESTKVKVGAVLLT